MLQHAPADACAVLTAAAGIPSAPTATLRQDTAHASDVTATGSESAAEGGRAIKGSMQHWGAHAREWLLLAGRWTWLGGALLGGSQGDARLPAAWLRLY